jgi:hypothetical protein
VSDVGTEGGPPAAPETVPQPQVINDAEEERSASVWGTLKTLIFIIGIQLFALYITRVNAPAVAASGYSYAPAGTSSSGSVYNVLILVGFVFAATLGAVWLARRRKVKIFMAVVIIGTGLALFLLTLLTSVDVTSSYLDADVSLYLSLAFASATLVILALVTLRRIPPWSALVLTGLLSAEVGSYFASTIPILTALLLPIAFSLYDIYTVFRGPLKTLVTTLPSETLSAISSKIGDFSIGTGDTVFYAMVPALAYYQFSALTPAITSLVAVDIGVAITLYLLSKAKLLPGLPIPMFLGVAVLLAFYFG